MSTDNHKPAVLQVLPSLVTGGVERGTIEMVAALKEAGWTPIVASSGGPMAKEVARLGGKHITLPLESKNPWVMWKNVEKLAQIIDAYDVKIVHARSRAPAWSAWHAAHRTGQHFITTFHNAYGHETALKRFYNSVMAKGERVIAISAFVAEHAEKTYKIAKDKIRMIPRGVNIERFDRSKIEKERADILRQSWKIKPDLPVIIMPGRLTRWKGQPVFIEAIAKLKRTDMTCVIVGSGGDAGYRNELIAAIQQNGLQDTVHVVDECRDMAAAFSLADIMVSASTRPEGFGRVIVEAQAMGCFVVATEHGGAEETIKHGETGWLVPPGNADKLTEALQTILAMPVDERKKIGKKAIAAVHADFTTAMMTERTIAVYEEVLAEDAVEPVIQRSPEGMSEEPKPAAEDEKAKAKQKKVKPERILVIRFGALGDLVMCRQAFHEIREAHKGVEIALLTTPAYESFAQSMPWFDTIIAAERASLKEIDQWIALIKRLYAFGPKRVYDLQGKFRQSVMFWLMGGPIFGPEWSGAAPGCSHPRPWPPAKDMHFVDFLAAQLRKAGVNEADEADLSWLDAPIIGYKLPAKYALLIPGCSPQLLHKRWPAEKYAALAKRLKERGITCVAIGTKTEADTIASLRKNAPDVVDLCGQTSLYEIASLAQKAVCIVGNDTGPMHLAAAMGAPTLAVLSSHTNPVWSAPYGPQTAWVKKAKIEDVSVDEVFLALEKLGVSN